MERGDGSQVTYIRIHLLIMNARNKETMAAIYVSFSRARGFIDKYLDTNCLHRMLQHQGNQAMHESDTSGLRHLPPFQVYESVSQLL